MLSRAHTHTNARTSTLLPSAARLTHGRDFPPPPPVPPSPLCVFFLFFFRSCLSPYASRLVARARVWCLRVPARHRPSCVLLPPVTPALSFPSSPPLLPSSTLPRARPPPLAVHQRRATRRVDAAPRVPFYRSPSFLSLVREARAFVCSCVCVCVWTLMQQSAFTSAARTLTPTPAYTYTYTYTYTQAQAHTHVSLFRLPPSPPPARSPL